MNQTPPKATNGSGVAQPPGEGDDVGTGIGVGVGGGDPAVGGYQPPLTHVPPPNAVKGSGVRLPDDAVMMNVGDNIGAFSLRLASAAPRGELHAFEPSDATFARLARNVGLNSKLAARIKLTKAFVSDVRKGAIDTSVYARCRSRRPAALPNIPCTAAFSRRSPRRRP